jgi:hypothetical protein
LTVSLEDNETLGDKTSDTDHEDGRTNLELQAPGLKILQAKDRVKFQVF